MPLYKALPTSPTFIAPALGTPASGVMTNVTGTAANLTAGTTTTNANLTGDVTSSGNATTIAWNRNPYCFRAYASGATTLTDATAVKIALATESYDYNNNFADSTYTAPVAGVYHFDSMLSHASVSATPVGAYSMIYKNGAVEVYSEIKPGGTAKANMSFISCDILLAANDTIELYHFQDSAGNEATLNNAGYTWLSGHLVHRTA